MGFIAGLRYALRTLSKSPGFTAASILILALGIGANTAIFSVVHAIILKRLPFADPGRLVFLWERYPNMPDPPGGRIEVAAANYREWKKQNTVFSGMSAFGRVTWVETGIPRARHVEVGVASADFFTMLGVRARVARVFTPEEEQRGRDFVVILTDGYFEKRFGRDPGCVGKSIVLDGHGYTILGVLPPEFRLPATHGGTEQVNVEVWVPLSRVLNTLEDENRRGLLVMARLKPGTAFAGARAEMTGIAARLAKANPKLNESWTVNVSPLADENDSPALHRALWVLLVAVAFVLLIVCANLANLALARASRRTRDFGVRIALGGARRHLVSQLLTESLMLSAAGGVLGLFLAHWIVKAMLALRPPEILVPAEIRLNAAVFAFSAAVAVMAAILFGLAPALSASRTDVVSALKAGAGSGTPRAHRRQREVLMAVEVALALVLLAGAACLLGSFHALLAADLGFQPQNLLTLDVDLPENTYRDEAARARFNRQMLDRLNALPGVVQAAVADGLPMHRIWLSSFSIIGRPAPEPGQVPLSDFSHISPGYFAALGARLRSGRLLTDADIPPNPKDRGGVMVINEALARRYWPHESALGQRIEAGNKTHEIVGILTDHHQMGVDAEVRPAGFFPWLGMPNPIVLVRTRSDPTLLAASVEREIRALDKDTPISSVRAMRERVDEWLGQRRFNAVLLATFATMALVLAGMGIYSVLANIIAGRTREIGIRMSLGAGRGDVAALVFRQSMIPVAVGLGLGLAGVLLLSRYLEALVWRVKVRDPLLIGGVTLVIVAVAAAATWLPARRAARLDPGIALRQE